MRYKHSFLFIVAICWSFVLYAQPLKKSTNQSKRHKYIIKASILKNHNRESKDFDHDRKMSVQNRNTDFLKGIDKYSYQVGLLYEFSITKNILVSPSVIFGEHRYEYRWDFTFDYFFDRDNATSYTTEYKYAKKMVMI